MNEPQLLTIVDYFVTATPVQILGSAAMSQAITGVDLGYTYSVSADGKVVSAQLRKELIYARTRGYLDIGISGEKVVYSANGKKMSAECPERDKMRYMCTHIKPLSDNEIHCAIAAVMVFERLCPRSLLLHTAACTRGAMVKSAHDLTRKKFCYADVSSGVLAWQEMARCARAHDILRPLPISEVRDAAR